MASAAGLKTLAARVRTTYLLRTAAADVTVTTYHGVCALRTIDTIIAVRTAPLGNVQRVPRARRISASITPAATSPPKRPGATTLSPSRGAAIATSSESTMVRRPLGVLRKNRRTRWALRPGQRGRFESLERGGQDQTLHAVPAEQRQALGRAEHERRRRERVGEHRRPRDHGHAGGRGGGRAGAGIDHVL